MSNAEQVQSEPNWPFKPDPNEHCSRAMFAFLDTHYQIFDFFFFGVSLATKIDDHAMIAAKALARNGDQKDLERLEKLQSDPNPTFDRLRKFATLQSENICIRLLDNFSTYLSDIIQSVMMKRPEILKSGETIKIEDALKFGKQKDLISFLVNRKVNELSYMNILEVEKFIKDRTGLIMANEESDKTNLMIGIELRNIYTHSRGVATETTIRRLSNVDHGKEIKIGVRYTTDFDELVSIANSLLKICRNIDAQFCKKFRIRRGKYISMKRSLKSD